jgi:hypothetical protein
MTFKDYNSALKGRENEPASLKTLLSPFSIEGLPTQEDEFLLVGHVLDAIADEKPNGQALDAAFILELALDLGLSA